jgi:pyridoxal phosphate enzyme (YggS family)
MPRLITGLDAGRIAANLERVRETIADAGRDPATVEVLAAVKYVPIDEIGTLHEAGLTLLGENRAQELEDKATLHPGFRWHFIGQLQSRKVKQVLPFVELIHSVASESALKQLELHGTSETEILLEVNVAGEAGKAGIEPGEIARYLEASTAKVVGLMTMPPFAENPEGSRPHFARLAELAAEHSLPQLSMGTSQDFAIAAAEGATIVRIGTTLYT